MKQNYFQRLNQLSSNRFWVNNPTPKMADLAVAAGAVACTTNPTYAWKQFQHQETHEEVLAMIDQAIKSVDDDQLAADMVQKRCVERILPRFADLHKKSGGTEGFVSIQGNPFEDDDPEHIIEEARDYFRLGSNVIAKIPATRAGLDAIERLVAEGMPVIATEGMSVSQALYTCELYERACRAGGTRPPFFLTHITGIFDQYLLKEIEDDRIEIQPDIAWQAGTIVARRQYQLMRERGFSQITMLGGGARGTHHFTELVGGNVHITINWSPTAEEIIASDPPVIYRLETPTPPFVLDELLTKVPTFRTAYEESAIGADDFEKFGPVKLFRSMFCDGWANLVRQIGARRSGQT